jgi:hypothetical protein
MVWNEILMFRYFYYSGKQCIDVVRQMDINLVKEKREKAAF